MTANASFTADSQHAGAVEFSRHADLDALVASARDRFVNVVVDAQRNGALARVVLTGGGAGIALLEALRRCCSTRTVDATTKAAIDWSRVLVFFGDERFVAADSPDRNEGQAREALLEHVGIPDSNIFGYLANDGVATPEQAAKSYEASVQKHAPEGFDLHLLGMGGEGHINSLFPDTNDVAEESALVVAVHNCPKPPPTRVSLTMPAIASADRVWLLVSGAAKAEAVKEIAAAAHLSGSEAACDNELKAVALKWPAAAVRGRVETVVFVDAEAASKL